MVRVAPEAILLMVTNPVDVITELALHSPAFPGSAHRLRYRARQFALSLPLARHCGVAVQTSTPTSPASMATRRFLSGPAPPSAPSPLVIGPSTSTAVSLPPTRISIVHNVTDAAYQVIQGKGATNYAIGLAVTNILEACSMTNSASCRQRFAHGFHGLDDVCLSLPRIVGRSGIEAPLPIPTTVDEEAGLAVSAERILAAVHALRARDTAAAPADQAATSG